MNGWRLSLLVVFAGTGLALSAASPPSAAPTSSKSSTASSAPVYVGAQSCSTSACHGSLTENLHTDGIRFDEYDIWMNDPHAKAYRILFAPRSLRMFQQLQVMTTDGKVIDSQKFEQYWQQCIACHNPSHPGEKPILTQHQTLIALPGEGVGCEGCHGPAGDWLHRHYRKDWKNLSLEKKASFGFELTQTLPGRTRSCASCHVGDENREVNHDLIAAGHPALKFELVWYEQRLPPHWKPERRVDREPALKKWLAGQLVGAEESLRQLQRRADRASASSGIWPELSEYRCFTCHHDLIAGSGWPAEKAVMPYGPWDLTLTQDLAQVFPSSQSKAFLQAHKKLVEAMNSNPFGKPERVIPLVTTALNTLTRWEKSLDPSAAEVATAIRKLSTLHDQPSWEHDAQLFLALAAPYRAEGSIRPAELEMLRSLLSFPITPEQAFDSPRNYLSSPATEPDRESSPQSRSQKLIERLLKNFDRESR